MTGPSGSPRTNWRVSGSVLAISSAGVPWATMRPWLASLDPETRQFVRGEPDGPVKFHYPAPELALDFGLSAS